MRGSGVVIGSSDGWLVTADDRGALRMANPATGSHADLPPITYLPFLSSSCSGNWFCFDVHSFLQIQFAGAPPAPDDKDWGHNPPRTYTLTAAQMRQRFYRKVVLSSSSPPPPGNTSYAAAMLLTDRHIGAPAFATAADPAGWRMAPSPDGVEDAIYHGGRFVSITYAGHVEAWRRDAATGELTSEAAAPRLDYADKHLRRRYLAAAPDGQLMAVLKHSREQEEAFYGSSRGNKVTRVFFKVLVLDRDSRRWEEAAEDIGGVVLFVGANASMCVLVREHRGISAGCVYFTDDEVGWACMRHERGAGGHQRSSHGEPDDTELREAGVYSLKTGMVERIAGEHPRWPPPAWFMPSFP